MKKLYAAVLVAVSLPMVTSAQWVSQIRDDFDGGGEITSTPDQVPAGPFTANLNFDYVNNTVPAVGLAPGATDGTGLLLTANENTPGNGVLSTSFLAIGNPADTNHAIEAVLLPYLSTNNDGVGGTTFGGIAVRASGLGDGTMDNGYYAEFRTGNSASLGSYFNLYEVQGAGAGELLGRYYFQVGSGGIVAGSLTAPNESKAVRDPQSGGTNTWIKARMEIETVNGTEARLRVLIDDVVAVDWVDTTPVPAGAGAAALFHNDFFASSSNPAGTVGTIFDYAEYFTGGSSVGEWSMY